MRMVEIQGAQINPDEVQALYVGEEEGRRCLFIVLRGQTDKLKIAINTYKEGRELAQAYADKVAKLTPPVITESPL